MKKLFIGSIILLILISGCETETKSKGCGVGDDCILNDGSNSGVAVAINEQAYDNLMDSAIAKDSIGYKQVFNEGRAFIVDTGTKVKVLDTGIFRTKIRIMEGKYFGQAGWVAAEWVIPK